MAKQLSPAANSVVREVLEKAARKLYHTSVHNTDEVSMNDPQCRAWWRLQGIAIDYMPPYDPELDIIPF